MAKSAPLDTAVHLPPDGARSGKRSKSALASAACVTKTDAGPLPHLATPSTHPSQYSMAGTPSTGRRHGSHRSPGLTSEASAGSPEDLISAASAVPRSPPRMMVLTPATSPLHRRGRGEGGGVSAFGRLGGNIPFRFWELVAGGGCDGATGAGSHPRGTVSAPARRPELISTRRYGGTVGAILLCGPGKSFTAVPP